MKIIPTSHAESLINSKRSKGKTRQEKAREGKRKESHSKLQLARSLAHSDSFSLAYINHDELAKFESIFIETNKQKN